MPPQTVCAVYEKNAVQRVAGNAEMNWPTPKMNTVVATMNWLARNTRRLASK
jgi:hypothetical protein